MDLVEVSNELRDEQELTNEKLDGILAAFEKMFEQQARDKLDLLEAEKERKREEEKRDRENARRETQDQDETSTPSKSTAQKVEDTKGLLSTLFGLGALAGLGKFLYDQIKDDLKLPDLSDLITGSITSALPILNKMATDLAGELSDIMIKAAKKGLLGEDEEGNINTAAEAFPAARASAQAANALNNLPNYLRRDNPLVGGTPRPGIEFTTANGKKVTTTGKAAAEGYIQVTDGANTYAIKRDQFDKSRVLNRAAAKILPTEKGTISKRVGSKLQDFGVYLDRIGIPAIDKIPKLSGTAIRVSGAVAKAATPVLTGMEYVTAKEKITEILTKKMPDASPEEIDRLADYYAREAAAGYFAAGFGDIAALGLDATVFLARTTSLGKELTDRYEYAVSTGNFPSAMASAAVIDNLQKQMEGKSPEEFVLEQSRRELKQVSSLNPTGGVYNPLKPELDAIDLAIKEAKRRRMAEELALQETLNGPPIVIVQGGDTINAPSETSTVVMGGGLDMTSPTTFIDSLTDPYATGR